MLKKSKTILFLIIAAIVSCIIIYAGHFLSEPEYEDDSKTSEKEESRSLMQGKPNNVQYKHISTKINNREQEINILEVNLQDGKAKIKPILSYNSIFGFEKLSTMAVKNDAYAAINAGFFYQYGQPTGMVVIDGKLISNSTGKYPVLIIEGRKARIGEIQTQLALLSGSNEIRIDNINAEGKKGDVLVYTREYGTSNRAKIRNISVAIAGNRVENISEYSGKVGIPDEGMLITMYEPYRYEPDKLPFHEGDYVEFKVIPSMDRDVQAYECGSWIIREGRVVIGNWDPWIGTLENRDPRTAIGIKNDGSVVLVTADGRQPGYSAGMTGKELGEFLLQYGLVNAAMLDGGASTEMIVKNQLVNKPSYNGDERLIAGGIVVMLEH